MKAAVVVLVLCVAGALALPTNFDARTQWPGCVNTILDQGECGSCWDFCSVESFANRMCITGEASGSVIVSPEPILECSRYGCGGGQPKTAWNYLINTGGTTCTSLCKSGCAPYDSYDGTSPSCHSGKCDSGSAYPVVYYAGSYTAISNRITDIQNALYSNGPLQACFNVYNNFYTYFSMHPQGVYTSASGSLVGGHCVKLIGWGVEGSQDYWLFANSWGTDWADSGFFKMARGINLCGIEDSVSEGFTKKQTAALGIPQGFVNASDITVGGWHAQSEVDNEVIEIFKTKLFDQEVVDFHVNSFETQVVKGMNFRLNANARLADKTEVKVNAQLHKSLDGEYKVMKM
jgi:cathepsin B